MITKFFDQVKELFTVKPEDKLPKKEKTELEKEFDKMDGSAKVEDLKNVETWFGTVNEYIFDLDTLPYDKELNKKYNKYFTEEAYEKYLRSQVVDVRIKKNNEQREEIVTAVLKSKKDKYLDDYKKQWENIRYFSLDEFLKRQHIDNFNMETLENILRFAHQLDEIRELWGAPLHVNSGLRTEKLNLEVGGARHSYHLVGLATDFSDPKGDLAEWCLQNFDLFPSNIAMESPLYTPGWVHLQAILPRSKNRIFIPNTNKPAKVNTEWLKLIALINKKGREGV